jgi:hypothetical protein
LSDSIVGILFGIFVGFGFGVGCTLAVMYSIYMGGYRKAIEESLLEKTPERFAKALQKVQAKLSRQSSQI